MSNRTCQPQALSLSFKSFLSRTIKTPFPYQDPSLSSMVFNSHPSPGGPFHYQQNGPAFRVGKPVGNFGQQLYCQPQLSFRGPSPVSLVQRNFFHPHQKQPGSVQSFPNNNYQQGLHRRRSLSTPPPRTESASPEEEPPAKQIKILVNDKRNRSGSDSSSDHSDNRRTEHLLQDVWTFWYLRFEKNFSWEHSQLEIGDSDSVEKFWGIFDQLVPLTEAHHGCNYSLFKKGIRPIWEDPMNRHGGRFVFTITKEDRAYKEFADNMWLEFSMAVVGNVLPDVSEQICGIIGGNRNNLLKIAVWTRDSTKEKEILKIGKHFKKISKYPGMVPYEVHMDAQLQRPHMNPYAKVLFKV